LAANLRQAFKGLSSMSIPVTNSYLVISNLTGIFEGSTTLARKHV